MLSKEEIERKLEQTEDDQITINLLYQKIDLLEEENYEANNIISDYIDAWRKLKDKLQEDIKIYGNYEKRKQMCKEQLYENDAKWYYAQEILEIIGGEN